MRKIKGLPQNMLDDKDGRIIFVSENEMTEPGRHIIAKQLFELFYGPMNPARQAMTIMRYGNYKRRD
jgi:hypothetical protein